MRSLLVAAALGLGLLAAGTTMDTAAAAPFPDRSSGHVSQLVVPVHNQRGHAHRGYHRPHYTPPHHWRRPAPPPQHGWRQQRPHHSGYRY